MARFLYGEFFSFVPTFKIWMATNHKPVIKGNDFGIWRCIKLVPFTTRIEEERQDKRLEQKLMAEAPRILNWLIDGARLWQAGGLKAPKTVLSATAEYKAEMDVIGDFVRDRCEMKGGASIRARELFRCYQDWCEENNEKACSERFFGLKLKEIGVRQARRGRAVLAGLGGEGAAGLTCDSQDLICYSRTIRACSRYENATKSAML